MNSHLIITEDKSFQELNNYLAGEKYSSIIILADSNTAEFCVPLIKNSVLALKSSPVIVIPAGEKNKSIDSCERIISELLSLNADRKCLLLNVGGGTITDLGGFTASVYKRGINFINIPTTLMAMVDASIGGKTGVNVSGVKNIAGTFSMPEAVFIYPGFLQTLPEREYKSAYAEIIKHILLSDSNMWEKLIADPVSFFSSDNIPALINHSVKFKMSVVNGDFHDKGLRQILNLGHTFGHAIESCLMDTPESLFHGEAIAAGMIGELHLSTRLTNLNNKVLSDAIRVITLLYPGLSVSLKTETLLPFLMADKKNSNSSVGFSLLEAPGLPAKLSFPSVEMINEGIEFMVHAFINKNQLVNDKN